MEELGHRLDEQVRLVDESHVAALWQNDEPRACDFRLHVARKRRVALVVIARQDERRDLDGREPLRILDRREVAVNDELAV